MTAGAGSTNRSVIPEGAPPNAKKKIPAPRIVAQIPTVTTTSKRSHLFIVRPSSYCFMALLLESREKPLGRAARDRPIFHPRIHNSFSAVSDESRRREKAAVVAIHHHLVPF